MLHLYVCWQQPLHHPLGSMNEAASSAFRAVTFGVKLLCKKPLH